MKVLNSLMIVLIFLTCIICMLYFSFHNVGTRLNTQYQNKFQQLMF